ncbi:MAG: protein-export chaperone SecB [Pseudomonadota bacterium]|nr:protein-export chaperone SecB [Pseudomonadota bacterium]
MSYKIISKFIKEIDFKIPDAKTFFSLGKKISDYNVKIDIKSLQIKETIIEINTSLSLIPIKASEEKINTKIVYAAVVEFENNLPDKNNLEKIVLIEVPNELYADLRKIFLTIFESSGFKDIKIGEKVDFQKLYDQRKVQ